MKRITAIILVLALCFCSICVYADTNSVFTIHVDSKEAKVGETIELNINMENNTGILAMLFVLNYDPAYLKLTDVKNGEIVDGAVFGNDYSQVPYKMLWNSAADENFTDNGVLATLVFEVLEGASGTTDITLTYKEKNVYDVDLNPIDISIDNGTITIVSEENTDGDSENTSDNDVNNEISSSTDKPNVNTGEGSGTSSGGSFRPDKKEDKTQTSSNVSLPEEPITSLEEDYEVELLGFIDVTKNDWFYENVKYVVENELMNGISEDEFAPNNTLTRAMLVTVLYRNADEPVVNKSIPFADVDMASWYANAVVWAKQNGIVNGVTENEFSPDSNITREQIAAIMFRFAQYKGMEAVTLEENLHFTDADEISEYAVSAMNWAVGTGLMKGKSATTINPKDYATRAEIATILQRFIGINK